MWIVARTAWLAAFCLLGLGPFIVMKVVTGPSAPTVAADIADAALPPEAANFQSDTLAKADRLPTFLRPDSKQVATSPAEAGPPVVAQPALLNDPPKFVARHWHEGDAGPAVRPKLTRRTTGKKRHTAIASITHANGH
jgi:hypothetical protein